MEPSIEHGYATNNGVRIHYAAIGHGPLVVMIHGLDDWALLPGALNGTWDWLEKDLTLVTIPGAGHFVHQDATDLVNRTMIMWLGR